LGIAAISVVCRSFHPESRRIFVVLVPLDPYDALAVFVFGDFHVVASRNEGFQAGAKSVFPGPHDSFGIDPAEIRIEPLLRGRFVAFRERRHDGLVRGHGGVIGGNGRDARPRGQKPRAGDSCCNKIPDQTIHTSSLNPAMNAFYYSFASVRCLAVARLFRGGEFP
jgi:hypothetical protein